jgi:hypothetical protein
LSAVVAKAVEIEPGAFAALAANSDFLLDLDDDNLNAGVLPAALSELMKIDDVRRATVDTAGMGIFPAHVNEANAAAIKDTPEKGTVGVSVCRHIMVVGDKNRRSAAIHQLYCDGVGKGTITVEKGGAFRPGRLLVAGVADGGHRNVIETAVESFSKKPVSFS